MIKWIRIDDRLIHGTVASTWISHIGVEQVIVVSDKVANDEIQKNVLKMAAPGIKVHIFSVDKFTSIYRSKPIKKATMLILPDTVTALQLVKNNVDIKHINFGGMRKRDMPHAINYNVNFTEEEYQAVLELDKLGIELELRISAFETPENLMEIIRESGK